MFERILRRPQVQIAVGLSRSTIYAMMADGEFPKPVQLGKRAVGWRESDIVTWQKNLRPTASSSTSSAMETA